MNFLNAVRSRFWKSRKDSSFSSVCGLLSRKRRLVYLEKKAPEIPTPPYRRTVVTFE